MGGDANNKKKSGASLFFEAIGNGFKEIGVTFAQGDIKTKLSFIILGLGPILRGQFVIGIALLLCEVLFFWFMFGFGWQYLSKITTLGTIATKKVKRKTVYGDNSFLILLFGILCVFAIIALITIWYINIKENRKEELALKSGKKLPTNGDALRSLLDKNFDKTLLALPVTGVFVFTVLPIVFMILVAFTNYDKNHQSPTNLFTWVGLENFKNLVSFSKNGLGPTFVQVLLWTLIWAFLATFIDYFLGLAVAILINKKGIKFKKLWRTILVMTIAVPQFVSLLYVMKMFANDGLINGYLKKWGFIQSYIPFWTDPMLARITIIVVNIWIGIPYMMLIATGLLMNIPEDLYESAKIDGANGWQMFRSITLPYMLFVTGPFLLTQYTGNLNNFNVIYLLTQGKPQSMNLAERAGNTDLLVTWLYKMTVTDTNYKMAAVLGIVVFIVTAVVSLVVYNMLPSVRDEEGFQ
ncbi:MULTISPECIES: carbohydrate ABC transporter permease [unclassified Butyrivibrio]|uniref:carbohydrate ABC transporter permease n=1 Tax=unclassified Butyrivibrio TaxID=2639466 RepID=UPI0003B4745E|nr:MULTISPECIES: sugar ABC transporter permease [unclassified Butyrivibrio]SDB32502.1 arabinogalactan oligomer / maltooligosaccharide transport system permease protein [Butyrivibrio sp. INlla16]SEL54183.1 arabinogalactan oligomer / maltooligosaccharide transport system permease protein [Butyrivibrio sp. ob235]